MTDDLRVQTSAPIVLAKKFAADEEDVIEGFLVRYSEEDLQGETFAPKAFSASLLAIKESGIRPPLLWQHDLRRPIGSWFELQEVPEGVLGKARINRSTAQGAEAAALIAAHDISGLSVGFIASPEWRRGSVIMRATLHEGSLVSIPAAPKARVRLKDFASLGDLAAALAAGQPLARRDAEWLARKGFAGSPNEPDPETFERLAQRIERATRALKQGR